MIKVDGCFFADEYGRKVLLHGVNLGGSSKLPMNQTSHDDEEVLFNHRQVTFIGRPFPLEEADEHFQRLKAWGFNFLRFLVPWEAVEHEGPGVYDEAYLDYLLAIVKKAEDYGLHLFIDPHQDVWSRFSGGDGAPGWTYEVVGLDIRKFKETGAAIVQNTYDEKENYPKMIWPTNYSKLAAATMFTLFFGGKDFAPNYLVDGVNVGEYLQYHYINAVKKVAEKLKDCSNVIGFDSINEPSAGYIGKDFGKFEILVSKGHSPTVLQGMALGMGIPQEVEILERTKFGVKNLGTEVLNKNKVKVWSQGKECIWKQHGVWDVNEKNEVILLKPDYFMKKGNHHVDFPEDYMKPFMKKYTEALREVSPNLTIFFEHNIDNMPPKWEKGALENFVYAPHWYDAMTLFLKNYTSLIGFNRKTKKLLFGKKNIQKYFIESMADLKQRTEDHLGEFPTLIGEIGIPFDMANKKAYRDGNFTKQINAMDASLSALEANLLNFTLWNYSADNCNKWGDQWNDEDLSIYSLDEQRNKESDINDGGRALEAVIRPYAIKTAGEPKFLSFDRIKKVFEFEFIADTSIDQPTEIFIPTFQYKKGFNIVATDGSYSYNQEEQILSYVANKGSKHKIKVTSK